GVGVAASAAFDLSEAAGETAEVGGSCIIGRRQDVPVNIGGMEDRDLNEVACRAGAKRRRVARFHSRACDVRRGAIQTGAADGFEKCAATGGSHASFVS